MLPRPGRDASSASSSTVSGVSDDLPEPGKYDHHHIRFPNLKPNQKHRTMKPCKVCKSKTAYYCGALQCMKDEGGNPQMVPLCQDSAGCNKHGRGGRMCMEKHKRHSARFAEVHQKEQRVLLLVPRLPVRHVARRFQRRGGEREGGRQGTGGGEDSTGRDRRAIEDLMPVP